ncbi:hypothetical protein [Streptomyces sp. NBC_00154]|uniref:hypothetical protein n=1 Tax=Streptomyces sp. NBC_00154 TaxID=2975670 RepID=UPI002257D961|nr:hypothetical protein [Streptomyces sp. NBC_00154]MCX5316950.1 hypothetical protein [Streptomyces sp. NBC_00154]
MSEPAIGTRELLRRELLAVRGAPPWSAFGAFIDAVAEVDIGLERFMRIDDCDTSSSGASTCRSWRPKS